MVKLFNDKIITMKNNKIIYPIIASLMLVFSACEPIVEEEDLSNSTNVEGVSLVATQSTPGGNEITLEMETPGITGYWDFNLGKALTNKVTIVHPIPGKSTFTFVGSLGAEFFTKTVDVQVDVLDHPLAQYWYDLVSTNTAAGKTWVFYKNNPETDKDGPLWWFMSNIDNPGGAMGAWWNAGACCPPSDHNGKIHFDLNGATNYTYYETPTATPTKGSFDLDMANKKITFIGAPLLGSSERGNPKGIYTIVSLTEDKLVLYNPKTPEGNSGWTWVFRPE